MSMQDWVHGAELERRANHRLCDAEAIGLSNVMRAGLSSSLHALEQQVCATPAERPELFHQPVEPGFEPGTLAEFAEENNATQVMRNEDTL